MCLLAVCRILSSSPPRSLRLDALSKELVRSVSAESKRSTAGGGAHGGAGGRTVGAGGAKRLLTLHLRAVLMTLAQKVQLCSPAALCSSAPPMSHTLSAPYLRSLCALCALLRTRAAPSPPTSPPPCPYRCSALSWGGRGSTRSTWRSMVRWRRGALPASPRRSARCGRRHERLEAVPSGPDPHAPATVAVRLRWQLSLPTTLQRPGRPASTPSPPPP